MQDPAKAEAERHTVRALFGGQGYLLSGFLVEGFLYLEVLLRQQWHTLHPLLYFSYCLHASGLFSANSPHTSPYLGCH